MTDGGNVPTPRASTAWRDPRVRGLVLSQLAVVALVAVVLLLSDRELAGASSFVPALVALVGSFDLLCAVLLLMQFRDLGDRRALAISWAYVSSLVLLAGYAASFPGVMGTSPPLGSNPSTAPWLWTAWHTAFPVLLGLGAGPWPARWRTQVAPVRRRFLMWVTTSVCVATSIAVVAVVVAFDSRWPVLIQGTDFRVMLPVLGPFILPLACAGAVLAVIGAWQSRGVERWAALAATAALGDMVLTLISTYRYSAGWYAGRSLTVVSSAVVLAAVLAEFSGIKRRLALESERLGAMIARGDDLERLQRTLLDHMGDGVLMQGRGGLVVASNPAAARLLGLTADQMSGEVPPEPGWLLLGADGAPLVDGADPATDTLNTGAPVQGRIMGIHAPDDSVRWLSVTTAAARGRDGAVDYVISSMNDVTSRHAADLANELRHRESRARIEEVIAEEALTVVFQPIVELRSGRVVGAEALSRFSGTPIRTPDHWFAEAEAVGLGAELELLAITVALRSLDALPPGRYLSLNASPKTVLLPEFTHVLRDLPGERVIVEITEHSLVDDYDSLDEALHSLRTRGVRLAVDDVGAGFASLRHILKLRPDVIKLDLSITRGLHADAARRALAAAMLTFAREIGAVVVAEGVESLAESDALQALGIEHGQGYYLGRPAALPLPATVPVHVPRPVGLRAVGV